MFVVVLMLVASTCFAQLQSGPSNVVGYVKIVCGFNPLPGVQTFSTPFGLPFKFWYVPSAGTPQYGTESTKPSDIVGDQTNCTGSAISTDRILRPDNGNTGFRLTTLVPPCSYTGLLETAALSNDRMVPGKTYYYQNRTEVNRNLVLAGEVSNTGVYAPSPESYVMTQGAFNNYSWRDSRSVSRDDLNLLASGFLGGSSSLNSDRVVNQDGSGNNFWRRTTDNTWQGTIVTVEPGVAYWVQNRTHGNGTWNYDYDASGNSLMIDNGTRRIDNSGTITKMNSAPAKKAKTGSASE
jgi:hypothetical protein